MSLQDSVHFSRFFNHRELGNLNFTVQTNLARFSPRLTLANTARRMCHGELRMGMLHRV